MVLGHFFIFLTQNYMTTKDRQKLAITLLALVCSSPGYAQGDKATKREDVVAMASVGL